MTPRTSTVTWRILRGRRFGRRYVGLCTRSHHIAVLCSGKGTYCAWHRCRQRRRT
jgi:hypothetical protein